MTVGMHSNLLKYMCLRITNKRSRYKGNITSSDMSLFPLVSIIQLSRQHFEKKTSLVELIRLRICFCLVNFQKLFWFISNNSNIRHTCHLQTHCINYWFWQQNDNWHIQTWCHWMLSIYFNEIGYGLFRRFKFQKISLKTWFFIF